MEDELTPEKKIEELENVNKALIFYSDQIRFNSIIYQGLTLIIEKITKIEERLNISNETNK